MDLKGKMLVYTAEVHGTVHRFTHTLKGNETLEQLETMKGIITTQLGAEDIHLEPEINGKYCPTCIERLRT